MEAAAQRILAATAALWREQMAVVELPKLIPLEEWAERIFGDGRPCRNTLYNWRKFGWIVPSPIKIGRRYYVEPNAVYADQRGEMARRLGNGS